MQKRAPQLLWNRVHFLRGHPRDYGPSLPRVLRANRADVLRPIATNNLKVATRADLLGYAPDKLNR